MLSLTHLLLGGIAISLATANLLNPLDTDANQKAIKFQPFLDFDGDACYNTAAIDKDGRSLNEGIETNGGGSSSMCRGGRLGRSQAYVRQRCNHYWCAYLYGYYFEKDEGLAAGGHKHDWEHVIVWTLHDKAFFVSWSAHGNYETSHWTGVEWEGDHPKIVYHRGGGLSHSFRKAKKGEAPENETGKWHQAPLISLERMDCGFNRNLLNHNWGGAHPDLRRDRFGNALNRACPADAKNNEGFDPYN
ncbi:necrosis inducing protein [Cladorrhinum sp. PSN332]|nr:necrosis inducing protein [Cladorrhinum sp. PSN332]